MPGVGLPSFPCHGQGFLSLLGIGEGPAHTFKGLQAVANFFVRATLSCEQEAGEEAPLASKRRVELKELGVRDYMLLDDRRDAVSKVTTADLRGLYKV